MRVEVQVLAHQKVLSEAERLALLNPLAERARGKAPVTVLVLRADEPFSIAGDGAGRVLRVVVRHEPQGDGSAAAFVSSVRGEYPGRWWAPTDEDGPANGRLEVLAWENGRPVPIAAWDLDGPESAAA